MGKFRHRTFKDTVQIPELLDGRAGFKPRQPDAGAHSGETHPRYLPGTQMTHSGGTVLSNAPSVFQNATGPQAYVQKTEAHMFKFASKS